MLGSAHLSWLPSDPSFGLKAGISHNRLVDSLRSGCIPIASEMQSYLELRKVAVLGSDHGSLINQVVRQYRRLTAKHEQFRVSELERFSPHINSQRWDSALSALVETVEQKKRRL